MLAEAGFGHLAARNAAGEAAIAVVLRLPAAAAAIGFRKCWQAFHFLAPALLNAAAAAASGDAERAFELVLEGATSGMRQPVDVSRQASKPAC